MIFKIDNYVIYKLIDVIGVTDVNRCNVSYFKLIVLAILYIRTIGVIFNHLVFGVLIKMFRKTLVMVHVNLALPHNRMIIAF
jgi:hypothetical protein